LHSSVMSGVCDSLVFLEGMSWEKTMGDYLAVTFSD
jgi:hypothetical protein